MSTSFQELCRVVPAKSAYEYRLGSLTVEDYDAHRIIVDDEAANAISNCISRFGLCVIVAPRNRGKTFLAKTIGLKFLRQGPHRHVVYGHMSTLDPAEALSDILRNNDHTKDQFLYIIDDCHIDPDKSIALLDSLVAMPHKSVSLLFCTRQVGSHILSNSDNVVADLDRAQLVVKPVANRHLVKSLIAGVTPSLAERDIDIAVERLVGTSNSVDLRIVVETINSAVALDKPIAEIDEHDVLRRIVDIKLQEPAWRMLALKVSAISQFDTPVSASYAEHGESADAIDTAILSGTLRRGTLPNLNGLYYWLGEPSDAELYLKAAATHGLLNGKNLTDFTEECAIEYLKGMPINFVPVLGGARAQLGSQFIKRVVAAQTVVDVLTQLTCRATLFEVAATLGFVRSADKDLARSILTNYRASLGDDEIVSQLNNAPLNAALLFLNRATALTGDVTAWTQQLDVHKLGVKLHHAKRRLLTNFLRLIYRHARSVYEELWKSGYISVSSFARELSEMRLQGVYWALRDVATLGDHTSVTAIIADLGGAKWLSKKIAHESVAVIGRFLSQLRRWDEGTYQRTVADLDLDSLARTACSEGANALHQFLPAIPTSHRKRLLRRLTQQNWAAIVDQSTLAAIRNLTDDLIRHPMDGTTKTAANAITSVDLRKHLTKTRVGIVGSLINNLSKLELTAARELCRQLTSLDPHHLSDLVFAEPPDKRLERLGLLFRQITAIDPSLSRDIATKCLTQDIPILVATSTLRNIQLFAYELLKLEPHLLYMWLNAVTFDKLAQMLSTSEEISDAIWLVWNVLRGDKTLGSRLLNVLAGRDDFVERLSREDLLTRLSYRSIAGFVGVYSTPPVHETPEVVALNINMARGSSKCLAAYAVFVSEEHDGCYMARDAIDRGSVMLELQALSERVNDPIVHVMRKTFDTRSPAKAAE